MKHLMHPMHHEIFGFNTIRKQYKNKTFNTQTTEKQKSRNDTIKSS